MTNIVKAKKEFETKVAELIEKFDSENEGFRVDYIQIDRDYKDNKPLKDVTAKIVVT